MAGDTGASPDRDTWADDRIGADGNIGDGKILILDLSECIRIRTGEKGPEAIG